MKTRRFGRTNWQVSEVGYGMWGLAGWTGSDIEEVNKSLDRSVELGCNFLTRLGAMRKVRVKRFWEGFYDVIKKLPCMRRRRFHLKTLRGHRSLILK